MLIRPVVILAETSLDITTCFITTQVQWQESTDALLTPNIINGLKKPSLIRTSKIATLSKSLVKGVLGRLTVTEIANLDTKLKLLLQIS
ncbi:MAG: type II toxin-antitoxin system PemK/MazF family toxin [Sphingobacteriales bacterium]|nr:MAG: type II toxin-antitoxin system PemK/MazF family toxin [Sphingobacteriales bacterium]